MKLDHIDHGQSFAWGKTSEDYAKYRDIYPQSLYQKLHCLGIGTQDQQVLDLGTGTGVLPRAMYPFGATFTGIDISHDQIRLARSLSEGQQMDISFQVSPVEEIHFPPESFDVVTAVQCFHYFDREILFPILFNILKPEGKLAIIHMVWLPEECEITKATEELILSYNPKWTGAGVKRMRLKERNWSQDSFDIHTLHTYDEKIPFTRESWRGRIRASRGIGASLSTEEVQTFDTAHQALLTKIVSESFTILHQITLEVYMLKG